MGCAASKPKRPLEIKLDAQNNVECVKTPIRESSRPKETETPLEQNETDNIENVSPEESKVESSQEPSINCTQMDSFTLVLEESDKKEEDSATIEPPPIDPTLPVTYAKVLFPFVAEEEGELSLKCGDVIEILDRSDEEWWLGKTLPDNKRGLFPFNFVEILVLPQQHEEEEPNHSPTPPPTTPPPPPSQLPPPVLDENLLLSTQMAIFKGFELLEEQDFSQAEEVFTQALKDSQLLEDTKLQAQSAYGLGKSCNNHLRSAEFFHLASSLFAETEDQAEEALLEACRSYQLAGQADKALRLLTKFDNDLLRNGKKPRFTQRIQSMMGPPPSSSSSNGWFL